VFIDEPPKKVFQKFITLLKQADIPNAERISRVAFYLAKQPNFIDKDNSEELENRWYKSLEANDPDYKIYDDPLYISEAWNCWVNYSRIYLKLINKTKDYFQDIKSVADLGCGIGFTTVGLKEIFTNAEVIGTNVSTSLQAKIASILGEEFNFSIKDKIEEHQDLIFASEYFEHFYNPIDHLREIIEAGSPNYLLVANAFNSPATGHFPEYEIDNKLYNGKNTARKFAETLKDCNYEKVNLGYWNSRPTVWRKAA
jgi:SAM-dependent methyltransferase